MRALVTPVFDELIATGWATTPEASERAALA